MDEHAMSSGIVPVRHPSYMPGVVKLPRRFEKAAMGDPKTARHRKISICGEPLHMRQGISARLDDLMAAIMWVKQELILLRQHDILLKRQFFDLHDSILSLQTPRRQLSTQWSSTSSLSSSWSMSGETDYSFPLSASLNITAMSQLARTPSSLSLSSSPMTSPSTDKRDRTSHSKGFGESTKTACPDFSLDPILVRPSCSASVLNNNGDENSDDTDGEDTFDDEYFRPRTSSMRTSRDLAALARRRGSKDLI